MTKLPNSLDTELFTEPWAFPVDAPGLWATRGGVRIPLNASHMTPMHCKIRVRGELGSVETAFDSTSHILASGELRSASTWTEYATWWQRDVVQRLHARGGGTVWLPPGSGKTLIAILFSIAYPGTVIDVVKAGGRVTHWTEVRQHTHIEPYMIMPKMEWRVRRFGPYETLEEYLNRCTRDGLRPWIITAWESLGLCRESFPFLWSQRNGVVIFDEAHLGKNFRRESHKKTYDQDGRESWQSTKIDHRTTHAFDLANTTQHRIATTATPIANRLEDLWAQLTLIEPNGWGKTASKFRIRYAGAYTNAEGFLVTKGARPTNTEELKGRLAWSVVSYPYETTHGGLPEVRRIVTYVPASDLVKPLEDDAEGRRKESVSTWMRRLVREAATPGQGQRQARARLHEAYRAVAASQKRPAILRMIDERRDNGKGKFLVLLGRRADCRVLAETITSKLGIDAWFVCGDATTEGMDRHDIQDAYMGHPGPCVLVATWATMGQTVNLQDTDVLIWGQTPMTPMEVDQGEGRGRRLGMTRRMEVHYLIAEGTVDEALNNVLVAKLPAVEAIQGDNSAIHDLSVTFEAAGDTTAWIEDAMRSLEIT